MSNIQHFDSLSIFMVDFDLWTGQTRLSANDFKLGDGGELPPEKLTQLGSKKVIDPDHLKGFAALKAQATRLMLRHGMRFMNGFAIPVDKTQELCDSLDAIGVEFTDLKKELLSDYGNILDEWINEHPDHADMIKEGALTVKEVEKRIGFEYQVFQISPMASNDMLAAKIDRKMSSLGNDLIDEITSTAGKFFNERFLGQTRVRLSTRQTLMNLRDKIDGLSFLNGALVPLVGLLNQTLDVYNTYATGGAVEAPHFYQIMAVVSILKDAESINAYADGNVQVESLAQSLSGEPLPSLGGNIGINQQALQAHQLPVVATAALQETVQVLPVSVPHDNDSTTDIADELINIERFFEQQTRQTHQEQAIKAESVVLDSSTGFTPQTTLETVKNQDSESTQPKSEVLPVQESTLPQPVDYAAAAAFLGEEEGLSLHW